MTFAARRRVLMDRLRWAPTRGPKRRALLEELRNLVREELEREVAAATQESCADLFDLPATEERASPEEEISPVPPAEPYGGRTPYWIER